MKLALARAGIVFSVVFILFFVIALVDDSRAQSLWEDIQIIAFLSLLFSAPVFFIAWYLYEREEMKLTEARRLHALWEIGIGDDDTDE